MMVQLTASDWKVLRAVARAKGKPVAGTKLRLDMSRRTKDGSFLTALVQGQLLDRVTGAADKPFEATYVLTATGKEAAEYGEYDVHWGELRERLRTQK